MEALVLFSILSCGKGFCRTLKAMSLSSQQDHQALSAASLNKEQAMSSKLLLGAVLALLIVGWITQV